MVVKTKDFKKVLTKLNLAIAKSDFNPQSSWIEINIEGNNMEVKVGNFDYYLYANVNIENNEGDNFHSTISADTFVPLISKIENEDITINIDGNNLKVITSTNEYTFPIITENNGVIDEIAFDTNDYIEAKLPAKDLVSIATTNAKGLADGTTQRKVIQQFIYFDNLGAITFTENIYINDFESETNDFAMLLNSDQAKLLDVFKDETDVNIFVENTTDTEKYKAKFFTDNITLVFIVQPKETLVKFPSIKLREIAKKTSETHAIVSKDKLDKALARLMVFDKKFAATVMNYSKIVWGKDEVKLVSIKNKNYEVIPYISSTNTYEHESMIRFADLVNPLKTFSAKEIDISYGDTKAIVINAEDIKQLIPEVVNG